MALIEWSKEYELGIDRMDFQHKNLVKLINAVDEISREKDPTVRKLKLKSSIDHLIEYTVYHFQAEEELLEKAHFPMTTEHKTKHENLTQKVLDFSTQIAVGEDVTEELLEFLKDWLLNHIIATDQKYVGPVKAMLAKNI